MKTSKILNGVEEIDFSRVTKVYSGADNACRCGCKGKYFYPGEVGFYFNIARAKKLTDASILEEEGYVNISLPNNKAITLYYE